VLPLLLIALAAPGLGSGAVARAADDGQPEVSQEGAADAPSGPRKAGGMAKVTRKAADDGGGITGLTLSQSQVPVSLKQNNGKLRPLVAIHGHFKRPGWKLFARKVPLLGKLADPTEFTLFLYMTARSSEITLVAEGPKGETENEDLVVTSPDAQEYRIGSQWGELVAFLGASIFSYNQTVLGDYVSKTGLLSFYYTTPKWEWRLGAYSDMKATLWTVSATDSGYAPQLIQGKADATWYLNNNPHELVETSLILGVSYLTLLSNGSPFGFSNLIAPEIGLRSYYPLGFESGLIGDFRYAPINGFLGFTDHGWDLTLAWTTRLANLHRVEIDLCISRLSYHPDDATVVSPNLYSLRFGFSI
jgi:hypothetical protein